MRTRDDAPDTAAPGREAASGAPATSGTGGAAAPPGADAPVGRAPGGAPGAAQGRGADAAGDPAAGGTTGTARARSGPAEPGAEAGAGTGPDAGSGPDGAGSGAGSGSGSAAGSGPGGAGSVSAAGSGTGTAPASDSGPDDTGSDTGPASDSGPDGPSSGATPATGASAHRRGWRLYAVLAAVLALLATGAVLLFQERQLRDTPATANRALTDAEATAGVIGDVSNALTEIFSYTPADTARTRAAAGELLAGRAARQYTGLFAQVEKEAARQKVTLTTHVVRAGVTRLGGDSAQLLVFLDQVSVRPGKEPATAPAQLSVTAELHDGRWRITDIASR
ncbi:hypothetical protein [Streptomyces genisteinicus]|uniref:Mce-associated membrane protein n=1 Tax=Streptomyces genisteinicus TaxID=2768068 RepID=A0A7H0I0T3_9ACTN|nr:hypothetical protein IAG43_28050 [Streptomyces genisteinicus]